jgi:hypothetical protein
MTADEGRRREAQARAVRLFAAAVGGAILLAFVEACVTSLALPVPAAGVRLRAAHLLFDVAETLGVGASVGVIGAAIAWVTGARRWMARAAAVLAIGLLVQVSIGENLRRLASLTLDGSLERSLFAAYSLAVTLLLPGTYVLVACWAARPWLRLAVLAFALAVVAASLCVLPDDYQGIHGVVACGGAIAGGTAIAPVIERWGRALARRRSGRLLLVALAVLGGCGVVVPPPNAVRVEQFRYPAPVAPWVLATTMWRPPDAPSDRVEPERTDPAAPSPRLLPDDAVVVLLTVDSLRADVVSDAGNAARFPTFAALKRDGVAFTRARAPGSQTSASLGALFAMRTFSELLWTDHGQGKTRFLFPADDPTPRFPELLGAHGVDTTTVASMVQLTNEFGLARGFREETVPVRGPNKLYGPNAIDVILARLESAPEGKPLFAYAHLMDLHTPYDAAGVGGTDHDRYLAGASLDDAQVGRVLTLLEARFGRRWALLVSADHGEAFGEHGTRDHGKTLYEELLRVPLLVRAPVLAPRVVDEPVTLADLGPTILDLFGVATPPGALGQSLAPLLAGGHASLSRPIVAEGRLRRALVRPDGLKVIEDLRRKCVEAYDLDADPQETRNVFDEEPARTLPALGELRAFFAKHARVGPGSLPYRP